MGYERAMYFEKDSTAVDYTQGYVEGDSEASSLSINKTDTFYKPHWFNVVAEEFAASRETVSLTDYSSFAKMDLWSGGTEVVDFLQRLCSNDVDIPIGKDVADCIFLVCLRKRVVYILQLTILPFQVR